MCVNVFACILFVCAWVNTAVSDNAMESYMHKHAHTKHFTQQHLTLKFFSTMTARWSVDSGPVAPLSPGSRNATAERLATSGVTMDLLKATKVSDTANEVG